MKKILARSCAIFLCVLSLLSLFASPAVSAAFGFDFYFHDEQILECSNFLPAGYYDFYLYIPDGSELVSAEPLYWDGGGYVDYQNIVFDVYFHGSLVNQLTFSFILWEYPDVGSRIYVDAATLVPGTYGSIVPHISVSEVDFASDVNVLVGFFDNFDVGSLLIVISAALAIAVGLVLLWIAFKFIKRKILVALRRGKV